MEIVGTLCPTTSIWRMSHIKRGLLNYIFAMIPGRVLAFCDLSIERIIPIGDYDLMVSKIMNDVKFRESLLDSATETIWKGR